MQSRELVVKKIDHFVFNVKVLNKITSAMVILFAIFFAISASIAVKKQTYYQDMYNLMLETDAIRQRIQMIENSAPLNSTGTEAEAPMFANAKSACIYAFDKFYNYSTYEIEVSGKTNSSAMGQNVEIDMRSRYFKYSDGVQLTQSFRNETSTNFGQSGATEIVYKNGKRYERNGSNLRTQSGKLTADFSGSYNLRSDSLLSKQPFYVVNSRSIIDQTFFSFVRDSNKKIVYYKATILLSSTFGVKDYAEDIREQGGTSLPTFTNVELNCLIDRNGELISFATNETMTLTKHIVIDISATTTNNLTYTIVSSNKTPSVVEPKI